MKNINVCFKKEISIVYMVIEILLHKKLKLRNPFKL